MAKTVAAGVFCALTIGVTILGGATPATAQDCKKSLVMLDSIPLSPMSETDSRLAVPASINGQDQLFLFDTGGDVAQISQTLADKLQLPRTQSNIQLYGVTGNRSEDFVVVEFNLGKVVRAPKATLMVTNTNIFTPVFMDRVDFDFDTVNRKLNILAGDHCPGQVLYWPYKVATTIPYTKHDNHITIPVTVDGKDFTAIVDTGASTSTMRLDLAKYVFGLAPDLPGMTEVGKLGGDDKDVSYRYPFKTLTFGDITVNNPKIVILPDIVAKNADKSMVAGGHITAPPVGLNLPQIIIGMDVLTKVHVYFAQGERKLYITDAGAPAKPQ